MEISPIAGIRVVPVAKVRPIDPELTASFEIESAARPDDDSYSRDYKKASGAEESEEETEDVEEFDGSAREAADRRIDSQMNQISFFA
jgi:hypothetical protein